MPTEPSCHCCGVETRLYLQYGHDPECIYYEPPMPDLNLNNIFTYHPPFGDQTERYIRIREKAKALAEEIQASCPDSRERSTALTNVQQAGMWANAAIAINEKAPVGGAFTTIPAPAPETPSSPQPGTDDERPWTEADKERGFR